MSPFLFALAMEYLSRRFNEVKEQKLFKFHPKWSKLGITHFSLQMTCYYPQEEIWSLSSNYTYAFKISQNLQDYKQIVQRVSFILVVSLRKFRLLSYHTWDTQRESCPLNTLEFLCLAKRSH
uniref:Putative ovule protein n=1 Tax=Solanum chacoense TaxID=4108 RepID=A0A0V0ICP6_SOLCH